MFVSFVSNFDRFSPTIARWLFTPEIRYSDAGNYTTPRDVTKTLRGSADYTLDSEEPPNPPTMPNCEEPH
jgi:hypothetical protein